MAPLKNNLMSGLVKTSLQLPIIKLTALIPRWRSIFVYSAWCSVLWLRRRSASCQPKIVLKRYEIESLQVRTMSAGRSSWRQFAVPSHVLSKILPYLYNSWERPPTLPSASCYLSATTWRWRSGRAHGQTWKSAAIWSLASSASRQWSSSWPSLSKSPMAQTECVLTEEKTHIVLILSQFQLTNNQLINEI